MKNLPHATAQSSHYDKAAEHYDAFNEKKSRTINQTILNILKEHAITSILDMTCGTGSQVFYLAKQGFDVVGSDINESMLSVARKKAAKENLDIQFIQGDMCSLQVG